MSFGRTYLGRSILYEQMQMLQQTVYLSRDASWVETCVELLQSLCVRTRGVYASIALVRKQKKKTIIYRPIKRQSTAE